MLAGFSMYAKGCRNQRKIKSETATNPDQTKLDPKDTKITKVNPNSSLGFSRTQRFSTRFIFCSEIEHVSHFDRYFGSEGSVWQGSAGKVTCW